MEEIQQIVYYYWENIWSTYCHREFLIHTMIEREKIVEKMKKGLIVETMKKGLIVEKMEGRNRKKENWSHISIPCYKKTYPDKGTKNHTY